MKIHSGQVYSGFGRHGLRARLIAAALLFVAAGCDGNVEYLEPVTDSTFAPGQVWAYHTRPGEEGSLFVVGAVDRAPDVGRVVHITVTNISMKAPSMSGGFANKISHLAVREDTLLESATEQVDVPGIDQGDFEVGYANWLDAYEAGKLFVQKVRLAKALDQIEASQNR